MADCGMAEAGHPGRRSRNFRLGAAEDFCWPERGYMTRDLYGRLKRLEVRITPWVQPLTIFVNKIPPDQTLAPGERIVIDELQRSALIIVVSERITTDKKDRGRKVAA